jgi:hypothetical protein
MWWCNCGHRRRSVLGKKAANTFLEHCVIADNDDDEEVSVLSRSGFKLALGDLGIHLTELELAECVEKTPSSLCHHNDGAFSSCFHHGFITFLSRVSLSQGATRSGGLTAKRSQSL